MTDNLEVLSRRMQTLSRIRDVARTMKTLSAVNAAPYERAADAIEAYRDGIVQALALFVQVTGGRTVPSPDPHAPKIALVFGSDHGLCGGYSETVALAASRYMSADEWHVFAVGAQIAERLTQCDRSPIQTFSPPASSEGIGRLASEVIVAIDRFRTLRNRTHVAVVECYMQRGHHGTQAPVVKPLLPLAPEFFEELARKPWRSRSLPILTMEPDALLASLLRNLLFARVFRAAAEAMVTENAARLALMRQAERAIDERYTELLLETRSVRQSEITSEILDVIGGFEALRDG